MSFFYPSAAAQARKRQSKEGQARVGASGTSRRPKDGSKTRDERASPPQPSPSQGSIYNQQNVGLEQLSELPVSGRTSPSSLPSPSVAAHHSNKRASGVYSLPFQPVTPASLQQYLEDDQDDEVSSNMTDSLHLPPAVRTETNPKEAHIELSRISSADTKSVQSEPVDMSQDKTPSANETTSVHTEPTVPLSRSTSHAETTQSGQGMAPHKRSFTPPALPGAFIPSQSPPSYVSPVPVRAQPLTHSFMPYGNHSIFGNRGIGPSSELSQPGLPPSAFYIDYSTGLQSTTATSFQRQPGYETPNSLHAKSNRRSVSYSGSEDETTSLLNRINTALPDFQVLLRRYQEISMHVNGDPTTLDDQGGGFHAVAREKDAQIADLKKEIQEVRDSLATERRRTQEHSAATQATQNELTTIVYARSDLKIRHEQLQAQHSSLSQETQKYQTTIDELRKENAQMSDSNEQLLRQSTEQQTAAAHINEAKDHSLQETTKLLHDTERQLHNAQVQHLGAQETLQKEHATTVSQLRQELEAAHVKALAAHNSWRDEVERTQQRETSMREAHRREIESLKENLHNEFGLQTTQLQSEQDRLRQHHNTRMATMTQQHQLEKDDLKQALDKKEKYHQGRIERLAEDNKRLEKEAERLKKGWEEEKARWTRGRDDLKAAMERTAAEHRGLMGIIDMITKDGDENRRLRNISIKESRVPSAGRQETTVPSPEKREWNAAGVMER